MKLENKSSISFSIIFKIWLHYIRTLESAIFLAKVGAVIVCAIWVFLTNGYDNNFNIWANN